jgi:hypothetical protein
VSEVSIFVWNLVVDAGHTCQIGIEAIMSIAAGRLQLLAIDHFCITEENLQATRGLARPSTAPQRLAPFDPITFGTVVAVLPAVAGLAGYLPAATQCRNEKNTMDKQALPS